MNPFKWIWNLFTTGAYDSGYHQGWLDGRTSAFRELQQDAHWFSQDPATYHLLKDLGDKGVNYLIGKPGKTLVDIRLEWQKRLRVELPPQTNEKT